MPLYRVPEGKLIDPAKVAKKDVVTAVERHTHWRSFEKLMRTYEEGLDWVVSNGGRVVWTKTGALFGHGSKRPHADVEHLWETVIAAVGDDRLCSIAVGTLLQLAISRRPENWLCSVEDTGRVDALTQDPIFTYQYWIGTVSPVARRPTVDDLRSKWSSR